MEIRSHRQISNGTNIAIRYRCQIWSLLDFESSKIRFVSPIHLSLNLTLVLVSGLIYRGQAKIIPSSREIFLQGESYYTACAIVNQLQNLLLYYLKIFLQVVNNQDHRWLTTAQAKHLFHPA